MADDKICSDLMSINWITIKKFHPISIVQGNILCEIVYWLTFWWGIKKQMLAVSFPKKQLDDLTPMIFTGAIAGDDKKCADGHGTQNMKCNSNISEPLHTSPCFLTHNFDPIFFWF